MIENLENLKSRTQFLNYSDKKELDYIKRKAKMYLEQLFPSKFLYPGEVDAIKFTPLYAVGDTSESEYRKAWNDGKEQLVNLLDTRIEEYKINVRKIQQLQSAQATQVSQSKNIIEIEKIVEVENTQRIQSLTQELDNLRRKKRLWSRLDWSVVVTIFLTLLGGSFLLGKYIGENRFDQEKIQLSDSNSRKNQEIILLQNKIRQLESAKIDTTK